MGKGGTAPKRHGGLGPEPGQPDSWPGTGRLSQALISAQTLILPASHLTPSIPRVKDATGRHRQAWRNGVHAATEVSQSKEVP